MRAFLAFFVALFGAVCVAIGLAHIVAGPVVIPGSIAVNATMDSEDRFYATLFVGFGVALVWCSRSLATRAWPLGWLLAIFFAGGVSRLVSLWQVGLPHPLFQVLTVVELVLPVALWLLYRKAFRQS
ncbi:MAG: DUF4345 domain-containing protein [Reyranellaceae bacterium]